MRICGNRFTRYLWLGRWRIMKRKRLHVLLPTQSHEPISQFRLRACINQFPILIGPYFLANQGNALLSKLNYNHAAGVPVSLFSDFMSSERWTTRPHQFYRATWGQRGIGPVWQAIFKNSHTPLQVNTIMKPGHNGSRKGKLFLSFSHRQFNV